VPEKLKLQKPSWREKGKPRAPRVLFEKTVQRKNGGEPEKSLLWIIFSTQEKDPRSRRRE